MQISSQFTIAIHMLAYIALYQDKEKVTSDVLSGSIEVNPMAKKPEEITLLDVYLTAENLKEEGLFRFHEHPNPKCPVGRDIHHALDGRLHEAQKALEDKLDTFTLADVIGDIHV